MLFNRGMATSLGEGKLRIQTSCRLGEEVVQILDVIVCISHSSNNLGKGMKSTILSPDVSK